MLLELASDGDCYVADLVPDMPAALCGEMRVCSRARKEGEGGKKRGRRENLHFFLSQADSRGSL